MSSASLFGGSFGQVSEQSPLGATVTYVDEVGLPGDIFEEVRANQEIANLIENWSQSLHEEVGGGSRRPSHDLFQRDRFSMEHSVFRTFDLCAAAVENDDVLSTLADTTEGIAIQRMSFQAYDHDQQDIWNQIARDLDMDSRLREMWRETFKISQLYCAIEWNYREYKVRDHKEPESAKRDFSPGKGNRSRRKSERVFVPTALSLLDPKKVVPVGNLMFGRERFAYIAERGESDGIQAAMDGQNYDDIVLRLIERKYEPSVSEAQNLSNMGINPKNLWLLKPDSVFRHHLTKAQYERFATPRLKSILPLVDMKQHLREADRASLVANTNFIVVIKKGTDKHPARQKELESLHRQSRKMARVPVIVGDHRLDVSIVAPPLENTLRAGRYDVLDARLVFRALHSFAPAQAGGGLGGGGGSSQVEDVSLVVSRGFENRRHQLGRSLERGLLRLVLEKNDFFTEMPDIVFSPRRISLDVNNDIVQAVLKLRDRNEISRRTTLEELDYDMDTEAIRLVRERDEYDDVFHTKVPHDSPDNNDGKKTPNDVEGGRPPGVKDGEGKAD